MLLTMDDFRIKAENFDLTKTSNILRIICGAFMFPHVAGKFAAGGLSAATVGFFAKAGLQPAELWVYIAAVAETLAGTALILGICTRYAALGAAAVLAIAVYSLQVVKGFGWTWNTGGYEYPVFWAIVCLTVALDAWKAVLKTRHRLDTAIPLEISPRIVVVNDEQLRPEADGARFTDSVSEVKRRGAG